MLRGAVFLWTQCIKINELQLHCPDVGKQLIGAVSLIRPVWLLLCLSRVYSVIVSAAVF